ncbi:hypothetical protein BDY24DRAFT_201110 [Mrakia frigida]|uniref:uncharacterized protein n=1 Tax=Mrakia frigida TaxID=29902 RepID=UPI003FCBF945
MPNEAQGQPGPSQQSGGQYSFSASTSGSPPPDQTGFARKSQRQPLSCTECTRRKTRCDKNIPCGNCVKRGKTSECKLEITVKEPASTSRQTARAAQSQLEDLRQSTTQTTDNLNHRLSTLEHLFTNFVTQYPQLKSEDQHGSGSHMGVIGGVGVRGLITGGGSGDALDKTVGDIASGSGSGGGEAAEGEGEGDVDAEADAAATLEFLAMGRSRAKSTGALLGGNARRSSEGDEGEDEEEEEEEEDDQQMYGVETQHPQSAWNGGADHPQRRPSLPSNPNPERPHSLSSTSLPANTSFRPLQPIEPSSAFASHQPQHPSRPSPASNFAHVSLGNGKGAPASSSNLSLSHPPPSKPSPSFEMAPPPPPPISIPTPRSASSASTPGGGAGGGNYKSSSSSRSRHSVISMIPNEEAGRKLIDYDMEMVSWLHCAYHVPTFRSECDLFWAEGATGEVEVNKSWLAMLFGVLMSALHHMPLSDAEKIFPGESIQGLLNKYFEACITSLNEANWMGSHSLYSVQAIAIIVSPANHLGKSDLYFTMLATAIRIAQALNINHLSSDSYPAQPGQVSPPMDHRALITREVCKRTWWQLVIQDFFHLPFNRSCAISLRQFDSAVPLHCTEDSLFDPSTLQPLSTEVPTIDSHTIQLLKLAVQVHKLFDGLHASKSIPYSLILQMDAEAQVILKEAPSWMQTDVDGNPGPLPKNAPRWLEWQRMAYLVSSSHKVIILHRPFLGRAFRDPRYQQSRDTCCKFARRILRYLKGCTLEEFRKTWTVLAHAVAASIILILEFSHQEDAGSPASDLSPSLQLVLDAIEIFRSLQHTSTIAQKGVTVLTALIEEQLRKRGGSNLKRKNSGETSSYGRTEVELDRAIKVLRRKPNTTPTGVPSSSTQQNPTHPASAAYPFPSSSSADHSFVSFPPSSSSSIGLPSHPQQATPTFPLSSLPVSAPYSPYLGGQGPLENIFGSNNVFANQHHQYGHHQQGTPSSMALGGGGGRGGGAMGSGTGGGRGDETLFNAFDEHFDLSALLEYDHQSSHML